MLTLIAEWIMKNERIKRRGKPIKRLLLPFRRNKGVLDSESSTGVERSDRSSICLGGRTCRMY